MPCRSVIQAHGLYSHWEAPFLAVDDNGTLARSMPVEQEPSTSSGLGRLCGKEKTIFSYCANAPFSRASRA